MTYTEWRDELKSNLLSVSENERRRVLDYYAEAYADRREAGFSEREIISDFGAPYDAAQRILYEKVDDGDYSAEEPAELTRREMRRENRERRREEQARREEQQREQNARTDYAPPPPNYNAPRPQPAYTGPCPTPTAADRGDTSWVFVLLCIIFWAPLFGLLMALVGITVGLCVAPIAVIGGGAAAIGSSIAPIIGGEVAYGFYTLAGGIITLGVGIALCPVCFKLVGLMWKLFGKVFAWIKSLFGGKKEKAI